MSGFVCILERTGRIVDSRDLERLSAALDIYGTSVETFCRGSLGIAIRHHRRAAEGRKQHGPLEVPPVGHIVSLAGGFAPVAGPSPEKGAPADTVCLDAAAYAARFLSSRSGGGPPSDEVDAFLGGVSGAFVFILADPNGRWIEIARDHLGSFKVYYALDRHRLIASNEPAAILRHGSVSREPDEGSVARYLGFRFERSERSFFRQIRELPPAHCLRVSAVNVNSRRYWRFKQAPSSPLSFDQVTSAFRQRLSRAIQDDMAGFESGKVALSLSGGLDSTAIAALAPRSLRAFSWKFDNLPAGDERARIEQVSEYLQMPVHWVSGDGLYPLSGEFADRFVEAGSPHLNPFSALKQRLYQAARAAGCECILVGDGGDAHFAASEYWLRDAFSAGRIPAPWRLAGILRRAVYGDPFARRTIRHLSPFSFASVSHSRQPAWLTSAARDLLCESRPNPILPAQGDSERYELSVGVKHSELESEERRLFAQYGIERGNPFWSWPLLELTIHLPAYWYHRDGRTKVLTREALRGFLPNAVLEAKRSGLLGNFFLHGLQLARKELSDSVFRSPQSDWQRYVRPEWLEPFLEELGSLSFRHTILWRVISYELWYRCLAGKGLQAAPKPRQERPEPEPSKRRSTPPVAGLACGVAIRGRLPDPFRPYLLPECREHSAALSLELHYRQIDRLPEINKIWVSEEEPNGEDDRNHFALFQQRDGFGLLISDRGSGVFQCSRRRIEIEWTGEGTGAPHYFFSYALPLWLEFQGVPVLHGSAVSIGDQAVGFVGPSGSGKSVLAANLARLKCGLLADDSLPIRRDAAGRWRTYCGPPLLRLWPSALRLLEIDFEGSSRVHETLDKRQLPMPCEWRAAGQGSGEDSTAAGFRLGALYMLERLSDSAGPVTISRMASSEMLFGLIEHSVAASPAAALGLSGQRFEVLSNLIGQVPVRRLRLPSGSGSTPRILEAIVDDLEESNQTHAAARKGQLVRSYPVCGSDETSASNNGRAARG